MPKNTGLGKGLDALFGNKSLISEEKEEKKEIEEVEVK